MDRAAVLALIDEQTRWNAPPDGPGSRVEHVGPIVRQVAAAGWNGVLWCHDAADLDVVIADQVRFYSLRGTEFEWKVHDHDRTPDLGARLLDAGFVDDDTFTVMAADLRAGLFEAVPPDGVTLVDVTDEDGVALFVAAARVGFGEELPWMARYLTTRLAEVPDQVVATVALDGPRPVASGRLEMLPGIDVAGIWGGTTVAPWRGRGIYRALVAHRARAAADRGYRYLRVDASAASRPILERLGFVPLTTLVPYRYRP